MISLGFSCVLLAIVQMTTSQIITWGIHNCGQLENKCGRYFYGDPGYPGISGPRGPTGDSGRPGSPGSKGPKGYSGIVEPRPVIGAKGYHGYPGQKGKQGSSGPRGPKGQKGDAGYGRNGPPGDKGDIGFPGVPGPKGFSGGGGLVLGWKTCSWKFDPTQEYGLVKECMFNKTYPNSAIHVVYEGSMRTGFCTTCCKRWFFTFDTKECPQGRIEAKIAGKKLYAGPGYKHGRLDGYCAVAVGRVSVELWVEDCDGHMRAPKTSITRVDTTGRIIIEEMDIL